MNEEDAMPGFAAVLVDVVGSRLHDDRAALQRELDGALARVNARRASVDPLTPTVGDELQAIYPGLLMATRAVVELRLELVGRVELRAGIGWGEILVHDRDRAPLGQDGPAWWAARRALERVAGSTPRSGYAARMGVEVADAHDAAEDRGGLPRPRAIDVSPVALLASQLALFDRVVASVDRVEAEIVLGDLAGTANEEIAAAVGISASAVSQRRTRNRLREVVFALRLLDTAA